MLPFYPRLKRLMMIIMFGPVHLTDGRSSAAPESQRLVGSRSPEPCCPTLRSLKFRFSGGPKEPKSPNRVPTTSPRYRPPHANGYRVASSQENVTTITSLTE